MHACRRAAVLQTGRAVRVIRAAGGMAEVKYMIPKRCSSSLAALVVAAASLLCLGGCPVDSDLVITETTRAALQAALDSAVDALAQYLAGT